MAPSLGGTPFGPSGSQPGPLGGVPPPRPLNPAPLPSEPRGRPHTSRPRPAPPPSLAQVPALWASTGRHPTSCTPGPPAPRTRPEVSRNQQGSPHVGAPHPKAKRKQLPTVQVGKLRLGARGPHHAHTAGPPPTCPRPGVRSSLRTGVTRPRALPGWGHAAGAGPAAITRVPAWPRLSCPPAGGRFPGRVPTQPLPSRGFWFPSRGGGGGLGRGLSARPGLARPVGQALGTPGVRAAPSFPSAEAWGPPAAGRLRRDLVITRVPSVRPAARLRNTAAAHLNSNYPETRPCQP